MRTYFDLCFGKRPAEELYDLNRDPHQVKNLAGQSEYTAAHAKLRSDLEKWMKDTADPRAVKDDDHWDTYPYYGGGPNLDETIRRIRMGTLVIETTPNIEVRVEQVRHEFWFGAALASQVFSGGLRTEDAVQYRKVFLENFNAAVTENALKWHAMEPQRGQVDDTVVDSILAWTEQNGIPVRGHNIFWGIPNRVQPWLKDLDDETLRETLKARALDNARRYRGRFAEYDLNNEMLHANYYAERLGPGITRDMAAWVHQADPAATLYLNDYDILTGRRLTDYAIQIREFLDQGVPLAGIGVQDHLHGDSFDPTKLQHALDRLAEFKLPIRVTEFNFPGQRSTYYTNRNARLSEAEEAAKAKALVDYYRICFAHPAVEGILMWDSGRGLTGFPCLRSTGGIGLPPQPPKLTETWCSSSGGRDGKERPMPKGAVRSAPSSANTG